MEAIGNQVGQFHDRVRAEAERARLLRTATFLAEASEVLARSLDYEGTLRQIAKLAVPTLADWTVVDVAEESGTLRRVAVAHPDPGRLATAEELERRYPEDPNAANGVPEVFRTGAPQLIPEVTPAMLEQSARDPDHLRLLLALDLSSVIMVPMTARGRVLGVISFITAESRRRYGPEDLAVAEEVAGRAALAVDNARLFRQAQQAEEALRRYAGSLEDRVVARTAELQASNDQLEAFSYSVSHDLRAPLRGMQGFAHALLEDYGNRLDETARTYAQRIIAASEHMDALVQDLLSYSRLSRLEFDPTPVSLTDAVEDAREHLGDQLDAGGAQLDIRIPRNLPRVLGHPATVFQVVANLISNAAKFVAPGVRPHIVVSAARVGPNVRLWVDDNGIGIAPEHHDRIFGVFERLHGREQYPGTGVGLAIVRKAMDRLGGRVGLEPRPEGGTRFWIELTAAENGS
jgi:signal transduction histidine kinase